MNDPSIDYEFDNRELIPEIAKVFESNDYRRISIGPIQKNNKRKVKFRFGDSTKLGLSSVVTMDIQLIDSEYGVSIQTQPDCILDLGIFRGMENLNLLVVQFGFVDRLPENLTPNLTHLLFDNCNLNSLSVSSKDFKENIRSITISNHQFDNFQLLKEFPNLESIALLNCLNSPFPQKIFDDMKNLKQLHLRGNKLNQISSELLSNNKLLEEIVFYDCGLSEFSSELLNGLNNLKKLDLALNSIETLEVPDQDLKQLEIIDLSQNKITHLSSSLRRLILLNNFIEINFYGNTNSIKLEVEYKILKRMGK